MYTLNQIQKVIKDYFDSSALVNSVYSLDDSDYNAIRDIVYPSVNIEYENTNLDNKLINHNFIITISTITNNDDSEAENYFISDCISIVEDFATAIYNINDLVFDENINVRPFVNDTGDKTVGVVFNLTISSMRPRNSCWSPTND